MKITPQKIRAFFFAIALCLSNVACDDPEATEKVATGIAVAARGIDAGIDTVRAFREAGKLDPQFALKLARGALAANTAMKETSDFIIKRDALDEDARRNVYTLIGDLLSSAQRLQDDGTLHIKNENSVLIFNLGIAAGRAGLSVAESSFASPLKEGKTIPVTAKARETLQGTKSVLERNDTRLKEAISRLSQ